VSDISHESFNDAYIDDVYCIFYTGAYYTLKTGTDLRIVGLNTNLYYTSNKQVDSIDDPADQFAWLENVLKYSNISSEKVTFQI
jgi:hypothetical protein